MSTQPNPASADEQSCRAFAENYPTPAVRAAISRAEVGDITWRALARLFSESLATGMAAVGIREV